MKEKIQILIVDDHAVVREGLAAILSTQADMVVVGEAADGTQAVKLVQELQPDVVLLDLVMPGLDGLAAIPLILEACPTTRILVLTGFADDDRVFSAIKSGALGYLLKDTPRQQLIEAIHEVARGHASLHPAIALKVIQEVQQRPKSSVETVKLTAREMETLRLIARGMSNQDIAAALVVDERTVAKYVSNILSKLHLANRTQAALYAVRQGLAE